MADNSPVAHEGNPKEDEIIISGGSVLSTATLGVVLPFVPATPPPDVPPVVEITCEGDLVTETREVGDCASGAIVDQYMFHSYIPTVKLDGNQVSCGSPGASDLEVVTGFNIEVASTYLSTRKCGMSIWKAITPSLGTAGFTEVIVRYAGATQGQPVSGIAVSVSADSTPCDFTAFVFLVDHTQDRVILGYYDHGNLQTDQPEILVQRSGALEANTCIYFDWQPGASDTRDLDVDIAFGSGTWTRFSSGAITSISPSIVPPTSNQGIIWCGVAPDPITSAARWIRCSNWFVS